MLRILEWIAWFGAVEPLHSFGPYDDSERSGLDDRTGPLHHRVEQPVMADTYLSAGFPSGLVYAPGGSRVRRHWFLDQNVCSRFESGDRYLRVRVDGCKHVHHLRLFRLKHPVEIPIDGNGGLFLRQPFRLL